MRRSRNLVLYGAIFLLTGILLLAVVQISVLPSSSTYRTAIPLCVPSLEYPSASAAKRDECLGENLVYGNYCLVTPYNNQERYLAPVTLCTQGTVEFLHHVVVLCQRWSGPISVAVYSPIEDYIDARQVVTELRQCDFCIRHWVTWHFFFPTRQIPSYEDTEFSGDCPSILSRGKQKRRSEGTYPINVGRNIARTKSQTPYVFSIDIELYPSAGILTKFERMLRSSLPSNPSQVWVFPIFEVHSKFRAPMIKSKLKLMYRMKQAISFHKYRCNICHKIPNLTEWINTESENSEMEESLEPLKIWKTVKRNKRFNLHIWEPFFIGTKNDPEFDIRLSWEGKQNKMQMAYEMCLLDYDFHIVENAFLVHAPGINVYTALKDKPRAKYAAQNERIIVEIRKKLQKKYGKTDQC